MTNSQLNKLQLWRNRFKQFENSSLSVAQFCQSVGCSIGSFYKWRHKLAQPVPSTMANRQADLQASRQADLQPTRQTSSQPSVAPFLQVSTHESLAISIQLRSGVVLRVPIEAIDILPSVIERVERVS